MAKKKLKKVRCATCENLYKTFCTKKKVSVAINKSRQCRQFVFDQEKVKIKQVLPTTRLPFAQQELDKQTRKAELKQMKEAIRQKKLLEKQVPVQESRIWKPSGDSKFPLTGDLSRFTTTGTNKVIKSGNKNDR